VQQQIQEEMEKEQANLKSAQMETLEKLRQNLDRLFADEESRLKYVYCNSVYKVIHIHHPCNIVITWKLLCDFLQHRLNFSVNGNSENLRVYPVLSKIDVLFAIIRSRWLSHSGMLCRADMADQLAKVKDEVETKARQDETELKAKKSALLDVIKKYVHVALFVTLV